MLHGRCEEALKYYQAELGAEVTVQTYFKEAPKEISEMPSGQPEKIMHAVFKIGDSTIMASDGDCTKPGGTYSGFALSITPKDVATGEKLFNAIKNGGEVTIPWQKTFWADHFGAATDKFGVPWLVNVVQAAPQA